MRRRPAAAGMDPELPGARHDLRDRAGGAEPGDARSGRAVLGFEVASCPANPQETAMTDPIKTRRRFYAEEVRFTTRMRSARVQAAFATVPRERFVGDGPWRVKSLWNMADYWTTEDADPANVYHDILIALDEKLGLNNGQPSLWAFLFDRLSVAAGEQLLHLGCGTGYYTAILAELAGAEGRVTAIEIEPSMAERARPALAPWPQIALIQGDGASGPFSPVDVIVASAGATHPLPIWIDALKPRRAAVVSDDGHARARRHAAGAASRRRRLQRAIPVRGGVLRIQRRAQEL